MKPTLLCLLFLPAIVYGEDLSDVCGDTQYVYSYSVDTYSISSSSPFTSKCRVKFERSSTGGEVQMVISGYSLRSSDCHVQVYDSSHVSKTFGDITGYLYFSKTIKSSDGSGVLILEVMGNKCDQSALSFTVTKPSCPAYTCDNGQCVSWSDVCDGFDDCSDGSDESDCYEFWTTGVTTGIGIAIFGGVVVVAAVIGVLCRRRTVMTASPGVIVARQTVVTQSRW